jgi:exodeoxyribonuclease VII small subunit
MNPVKKTESIQKNIEDMTFEEAYNALKASTDKLEGSEIDLESALLEYEQASKLARHCAKLLDIAEQRVRVLTETDGVIQAAPFESKEMD